MITNELHQAILAETSRIIDAKPDHIETYGRDLIDLPEDELILYGVKLAYPNGGAIIKSGKNKSTSTIEFTKTTDAAHPTFEWLSEITIKSPDSVEHYLLKPDQTIVETYGKNIIDVDAARAQALLDRLQQI